MNYVYRYMLGDQWIYVGKSINHLDQRVSEHAKDKRFAPYCDAIIEYCELNTKTDMDITESMLIKTMHPVINVVDSTDGSVPFEFNASLVTWYPYIQRSSHMKQNPYNYHNVEIIHDWVIGLINNNSIIANCRTEYYFDYYIKYIDWAVSLGQNFSTGYRTLEKVCSDLFLIDGWEYRVLTKLSHGALKFDIFGYFMCHEGDTREMLDAAGSSSFSL